jgi:hypothetical protein
MEMFSSSDLSRFESRRHHERVGHAMPKPHADEDDEQRPPDGDSSGDEAPPTPTDEPPPMPIQDPPSNDTPGAPMTVA